MSLEEARQAAERVMKMADEAKAQCAAANDDGPIESKPYDSQYYGSIGDIKEFNKGHRKMTNKVLEKAGGKFSTMKQTNNMFWKPRSKVFTKDFVKRFPKFASPP